MADGRLAGKVALIAGAGRGFGRVIALRGDVAREDDVEALIAGTLGRFGRVDDVAYCAVILASDDAGHLTGQILHPSGGWVTG